MKATYKTILLAALFLCCCHSVTAQQQRDTIQGLDVRYYRNCYWLDTTRPPTMVVSGSQGDVCGVIWLINQACQRVAFRFEPDRPLKIIGIAGAMTLEHSIWDLPEQERPLPEEIRDSVVANRRTEWFELYGTRVYDSVGNVLQEIDSLTLLGSLPWTLMDSSRFIALPNPYATTYRLAVPIIERYFTKPIRMDTVFYVGYTNFNRGFCESYAVGSYTYYYELPRVSENGHYFPPSITICEGIIANSSDTSNVIFQLPTSENHPYEPWTDTIYHFTSRAASLPLLFPIVDTMGMNIFSGEPDSLVCHAVEGFRLLDQQGNMAAFAWTQGNHQGGWQLSWGDEGITPEEGTLVYATTNVKSVVGLQDSVVYTAFVRARCNDTLFSEWSAPLRFWKGMNDTVSLLPHNTVEQLTYLYPNPAENSVTVACSFAMSLVELFALDGTKLISQPTNGIMTQIDLSALSKGTYMLRITTPAGTAIKKLVRR